MMRYPNVIFDFDGTLSDSYPVFTESFIEALHIYGLDDSYDKVYNQLKVSVGYCIKQYELPVSYKEFSERFHRIHDQMAVISQKPFPDAREVLEFIIAEGGKNFIFSHSGQIVHDLLSVWGWNDLFAGIVDATIKLERKPSPEGVYYILDKYSLSKEDTIIVGDRDIDTDSGRNAGIASCLFDNENYYSKTAVDYRIETLSALKDIVK